MAQVSGCPATFDVILYPVQQSMKMTHEFEEEIVKDALGQDASWRAQNEKLAGDIEMKLVDITAPSGSTEAHAATGAAFLAPLAIVTISGATVTTWNTTWQIMPNSSIDLKNDATGGISFRLRRYVDSTQNTLAGTTPG